MTICYLLVAEKGLKDNSFLSFQSDMNLLLTSLEQTDVITYEWLSKIEGDGKYSIALFDNDDLLSYVTVTKKPRELDILMELADYYENRFSGSAGKTGRLPVNTVHEEFDFCASNRLQYFASTALIPKRAGSLTIYILHPLDGLNNDINRQRTHFLIIVAIAVLMLFVFSWSFTKKLLNPIKENQKRQLEFVAAASHELRTPLAVMLSSLSAMKKASAADKEVFLETIEAEGIQMSRLVSDMLTLAGADAHSWNINKESVELDTLLINCYEAFTPIGREKKISIKINLPEGGIPSCICDRHRIEQVISILLHNALCYTPEGKSVTISLNYKEEHFNIKVEDNGTGISPEHKERIFERFYRADSARNTKEHFGLGLCIAKEIIDAHKGSITVADSAGGGAAFLITLP